jgi:hypothetical protein
MPIEMNMQLPNGMYCADCVHYSRCYKMFDVKHTNTECDFAPSRFSAADTKKAKLLPLTRTNTQRDEIIAGIVTYLNSRLASKTIEYSERQWCLNVLYLCGIQQ